MTETSPRPSALKSRLSVMMFLQYAIWGAWLPLLWAFLSNHRGFSPDQIADMFMVGAVGSIFAPFIAGQVADRWFATEKYLGLSHILGAVLVWQLATLTSYNEFLLFSLVYSLIYSPTLSLTNSLSFHHLPDRDRDFGKVRVWGTIGWVAVGIAIGQWLLHSHTPFPGSLVPEEAAQNLASQAAGMSDAFRLSAILGLVLGVYCFTLPNTPPSRERKSVAFIKAIKEARRQPLVTLFLVAIPVSCIHQFYFVHTAAFLGSYQSKAASSINQVFGVGGGGLMTIGQMSEIIVLALIPIVAKQWSRKSLLLIGLAAYAARMALFAYVDPIASATGLSPAAILIAGVAMHGLCFGCFIFIAFMVVDEETTPDVRASAQSLLGLVVFGIGIIVGSYIAAGVSKWSTSDGVTDYTRLFSVPMWGAVGCFLLLAALYPGRAAMARLRAYRRGPEGVE